MVAGLGPAGADLVTAATLDALSRIPTRFLRTNRHPAASVAEGSPSFDGVYEIEADLDRVYRTIADRLVAEAEAAGEVLYLVPGSPAVAERTVELLRGAGGIEVEVLPALSFLDLAWTRLGVDPVAAGVRVVDGHRFAVEAAGERGPLLVAQCDSRNTLSEVKLAVDDGPERPVIVLQRLGLPDEQIFEVAWYDLDRSFEPDHLTSVYVPELAAPVGAELVRFAELCRQLRERCPWDRAQTHGSLLRHLLEESYETYDAIAAYERTGDPGPMEEELGDLLFQVYFHATVAAEEGHFTLADVARGIHDKLVERHPHVFGDAPVPADPAQAHSAWEAMKRANKQRSSPLDGVPADLPALLYAHKLLGKLKTWDLEVDLPDLSAAVAAVNRSGDAGTIGELLLAVAANARAVGVDAEAALRARARAMFSGLEPGADT